VESFTCSAWSFGLAVHPAGRSSLQGGTGVSAQKSFQTLFRGEVVAGVLTASRPVSVPRLGPLVSAGLLPCRPSRVLGSVVPVRRSVASLHSVPSLLEALHSGALRAAPVVSMARCHRR